MGEADNCKVVVIFEELEETRARQNSLEVLLVSLTLLCNARRRAAPGNAAARGQAFSEMKQTIGSIDGRRRRELFFFFNAIPPLEFRHLTRFRIAELPNIIRSVVF